VLDRSAAPRIVPEPAIALAGRLFDVIGKTTVLHRPRGHDGERNRHGRHSSDEAMEMACFAAVTRVRAQDRALMS
jgi:hypothetical protein